MATIKSDVEKFLAQKHIAVVGVSRKRQKFGNAVYTELKKKGYQVYPVNPNMESLAGEPCYARLKDIPGPVDAVVLVVKPAVCETLVKEAKDAGITHIWMQQGSHSDTAIRYCQENNMTVIANECVMMFVEPVSSIHKFHRWIWKLFGKLPR